MPFIETPVIDGLPVAQAALAKTASNIAAAAGIYAETDHYLGRPLGQHEFATTPSIATSRAPAAPADQQASGTSADEPPDEAAPDQPAGTPAPSLPDRLPEIPSTVMEMAPQLSQMAGTVGTLTQSIVSGAQGATQNQPLTDPTDEETDKDDSDSGEQQPEKLVEGAAPGSETLAGVAAPAAPVSPPTADRPPLIAKETDL
jgi:hypothetical protein